MSYAGPASRGKRAPNIELSPPSSTRTGPSGREARVRQTRNDLNRRDGSVLFAAGVALGVVVGAGIALLLAPQTGEDTRRALARRGQRLGRRGRAAWDDLRYELKRARRRRRERRAAAVEA